MQTSRVPGWYIACRSTDLDARPLAVDLAGRHLALFRDRAGTAHALEDRCAHRGAPLSRGRICGDRLHCPYHGWGYDARGDAVEVPALPANVPPPDGARVPAYPVAEQQGFVWVAPAEGPPACAPHRFAHMGEPGWTHFRMRTRFPADVPTCLENFLDCPHATFVHRRWFRAPAARTVKVTVRTLADGAEAEYFDEPRSGALVWRLLAPRRGAMRHTDRFIAPNVSQVDYAFDNGMHYTITSCCTPLGVHDTIVHTVIAFRFGRIGPLVRLVFEPLSRLIIRQDVCMLAMQRANIRRFGEPRFVSTAADLLAPHIAAWTRALRDGGVPPAAGEERHGEIRL
ncbi:MAG: aromatic ring-hydroxylating dioxygenase subunit alpha [Betaproteobacteria bacterium]|nr:MAG: aromatic ring-hydroxylating dioxygenase subunit alpha [Betaproteobacteria bacterium]